jgi:hypothetical protein
MGRVPGSVKYADPEGSHRDLVAFSDGEALEADLLGGSHEVGPPRRSREVEASAHIVVVDVGLGDVSDSHARLRRCLLHSVDVPLRIDDQGDVAVVHQVAPISESCRVERHDF